MTDFDIWREQLDPPPGGLRRLIAAIEAHKPQPRRLHWQRYALASTAIVFVLMLMIIHPWRIPSELTIHRAIETAMQPVPYTGPQVENGAALELPSGNPNVRIFFVASLPVESSENAAHPNSGRAIMKQPAEI